MWSEYARYDVPLYPFMRQSRYGEKRCDCVYIVLFGSECVYVGKTHEGVRLRLWRHVKQVTNLGLWIVQNELAEFGDNQPYCQVVVVVGDVDTAERYYIWLLNPSLNMIRYSTSSPAQPLECAESVTLDLDEGFRTVGKYGAVTRQALNSPTTAPIVADVRGESDFALMERLYRRAFRDPNHPDFKQ